MNKLNISSGDKYNNLTVLNEEDPFIYLARDGHIRNIRRFRFKCRCGNVKIIRLGAVRYGHIKSCGCLRGTDRNTSEKDSYSRLYSIYSHMRQRCTNPNDSHYKDFGGKGIKVCKGWESFPSFKRWALDNGYDDKLEIYRKDKNRDFEPDNCLFVSRRKNLNSRNNTRIVNYKGESYPLMELLNLKQLSESHGTIRTRLRRKWDIKRAVDTPINRKE